jgi:hypothetical protein
VATAVACPNALGATSETANRSANDLFAKGFDFIDGFSRLNGIAKRATFYTLRGRNLLHRK